MAYFGFCEWKCGKIGGKIVLLRNFVELEKFIFEMVLLVINILMGCFIIWLGYRVKSNPDLIADYNTMPEHKKKKVDIDGLSTFMKKSFVIQGVLIITLSVIMTIFRFNEMVIFGVVFNVMLIGLIIMLVKGQKYYRKKKK